MIILYVLLVQALALLAPNNVILIAKSAEQMEVVQLVWKENF